MAKIKKGSGLTTSEPVAQAITSKPLPPPKGPPRAKFLLKVHPLCWKVMAGRVVPDIRFIHGIPGCNAVDRDRAGNPVFTDAIAMAQAQGWTVIPEDVDGRGTSYLRKVDQTGGYIMRWTTLYPGSAHEDFDAEGMAVWLDSLVERGILEGCPEYILRDMQVDYEKKIARSIDAKQAQNGARITRMSTDLEVIKAALLQDVA